MRILLRMTAGLTLLYFGFFSPWLSAIENTIVSENAAEEKLIQQLGSESFAVREAATEHLTRNALQRWALIKRLARHEDLEVRTRVRAVMIAKADVLWKRFEELGASKDESFEGWVKQVRIRALRARLECWHAEYPKKLSVLQSNYQTRKMELAKLRSDCRDAEARLIAARERATRDLAEAKAEEREALVRRIGLLQEKQDDWIRKVAAKKKEFDKFKKQFRLETNTWQTRYDQIADVLKAGSYEKMSCIVYPECWVPTFLPVAERHQLKVSFEAVDEPLVDLLKWLSEMTGLTYELEKDVDKANLPSINLRVTEMSAQLAIGWVCRLADLKVKGNSKDRSKVLIGKPSQEGR